MKFKSGLLHKIRSLAFRFTVFFIVLNLLSLVLMISTGSGNLIINIGMLAATLVYFCVYLVGTMFIKDPSAEKSLKRAGKRFYKYAKYFLRLLNILFLIMSLISFGLGKGRILIVPNIIISLFWLGFRIYADIVFFKIKQKIKQLKEKLPFGKPEKTSAEEELTEVGPSTF